MYVVMNWLMTYKNVAYHAAHMSQVGERWRVGRVEREQS